MEETNIKSENKKWSNTYITGRLVLDRPIIIRDKEQAKEQAKK